MKVIIEGLILSVFLYLSCALGIRKGAVNMVYLYSKEVQDRVIDLGLTTREKINITGKRFRLGGLCFFFVYIMVCVFIINGARGFVSTFTQFVSIILIMGVFDRIVVDLIWVGHTKAWIIPGTEDLMPYIPIKVHIKKWIMTVIAYPAMAALICWLVALIASAE